MKNKCHYDGVEYGHEIVSSQGEENVFKWSAKTLLKCITVSLVTKQLFYCVYIILASHTAFLKTHVVSDQEIGILLVCIWQFTGKKLGFNSKIHEIYFW